MSSKLSGQAEPFVPKSSAASKLSSLSAGAQPFNPVAKKAPAPAPTAPAATTTPTPTPTPAPAPPMPIAPKQAEAVAANSALSATAAPYMPTRTSPTSKGTPVFPTGASPATPNSATSEGPAAIGQSPKPVSPVAASADASNTNGATSSSSSEGSTFAASSLVVKNPKGPVAASEVPKFAFSWGLICNNHLDPKNYTGVEIRRVGDIEQFWRLWHHVPLFSTKVSTSAGSAYTYHWFKGMTKPSWEDPANVNGGIMVITLVPGDKISFLDAKGRAVLDDVFMSIVMLATGAAKAAAGCINGLTIKSRNGVALDLWLDTTDAEKIKALAEAVREVIVPLDSKYAAEKFVYMNNAQRVASPSTATSGYKGKAAKPEKKIEHY